MKKTKILSLVMAASLLLTALTACGKKSKDPASGSDLGDTPPVSGSDLSAGNDLAYIKANGKLIVGYTDFEPMNYTNDKGEFTGFDTELAMLICDKLGVKPDFQIVNWDTKVLELNAGTIDCIWNGMTINQDLSDTTSITYPYVKNAQVIIVKKDSGIKTTADLIGKTVVAEIGSAGEVMIKGDDDTEPDANLAKCKYVGVNKQTDCLLEVKSGTAVAAVLDWTLAKTMIGDGTQFTDLIMVPDLMLSEEEYGVAFRKGSDITALVNGYFIELVKDGTLAALAEKYGLSLSPRLLELAK